MTPSAEGVICGIVSDLAAGQAKLAGGQTMSSLSPARRV
jgi:hypothetical protein